MNPPGTTQSGDSLLADVTATKVYARYAFVPAAILFFHALSLDDLYRAALYGNIFVLIWLAHRLRQQGESLPYRRAVLLALPGVVLISLYLLSGHDVALKEIRHLLAFTFIAFGCLLLPLLGVSPQRHQWRVQQVAVVLILVYALTQVVAIHAFDSPFGTTKNPHYIAHYSLLLLLLAPLLYQRLSTPYRAALLVAVALLLLLLLHSMSRPAWLALILAAIVFFWLVRRHFSWKLPAAAAIVLVGIYALDIGGAGQRVDDLVERLSTEERVTIWRDTWRMQQTSSTRQWIVGHGIDSFEDDFKPFSHYHHLERDFNAPHNFVLELLYTSGVVGLTFVTLMIAWLYARLLRLFREHGRSVYIAGLISVLTANLLFTSITVSFFSSHHMVILGLIGGLTLALTLSAETQPEARV